MKFRKKPVTIEAIKFEYSADGIERLKQFCGPALGKTHKERHITAVGEAEIGTLEDGVNLTVQHIATEGDYIIKGVQGEFYPCKPDIFHATYEAVEELSSFEQKKAIFKDYKQWTTGRTNDGRVYIQDDDFAHDARLYVNGDFYDMEQELFYADKVADMLNAAQEKNK